MEDLNKTQMVLLCLLVSFVTSIGTGVITASLLREVPQNVTQTINRVVERTVQTITPQTSNTNTATTREVTVVVKEEDSIIDSISKSRNSLVRIVQNNGTQNDGQNTPGTVESIGVVIKKDGTILSDKRFVLAGNSYNVVFATGESYPVKILDTSEKTNAIFLAPILTNQPQKNFSPASFDKADSPQLGQTVVALGGKDKQAVAVGRISSIDQADLKGMATTTKIATTVETDTPLHDAIPGSILLNLNGEMVGFENFEPAAIKESLYTAIGVIRREKPAFFEGSTS